jgi:rhodanese-related sulfurtransferase
MPRQTVEFKSKSANPEVPGVLDVDPKEVWAQRGDLTIIDVRRPDEFTGELGHVPGAEHIVLDTLPQFLDQIPKDGTVVFVCRSGGRSARASAFVRQHGWSNTLNMRGGMLLWNELGMEVEGRNA